MEIWTKLVGRVRGANFASIYGRTKAMGYRNVTLPEGHPQLEKNVLLYSEKRPYLPLHGLRSYQTAAEESRCDPGKI